MLALRVLALWFCLLNFAEMETYLIGTNSLPYYPFQGRCPTEGAPVCATSNAGRSYVLFPNQCLVAETNQETYLGLKRFEKVPLGYCLRNCQLNCDATYRPVCAADSNSTARRTFRNICEMSRDACRTNIDWSYIQNGECPVEATEEPKEVSSSTAKTITKRLTPSRKRKAIPCPKVFNPVCATLSGVKSTFINECLVNAENIRTGKDWQVFSEGVCAEDYSNRGIKHESAVSARSSDPNMFDFPNLAAEYGDDINYIYAPPIIQTEYIDDDGSSMKYAGDYSSDFGDVNNDNNEIQKAPAVAPRAAALRRNYGPIQLLKPIRFPEEDDARVIECKYGRETICGSFEGQTRSFGNVCELIMRNIFLTQNWTILHKGDCDECSFDCSRDYSPLCVSRNGVNFTIANECYLNSSICHDKERSAWKIVSKGECQNPSKIIVEDKYESLKPGFRFTSGYEQIIYTTTPITPTTLRASTTTTSAPAPTTNEDYLSSTIAATTHSPYEDDVPETTQRSFESSSLTSSPAPSPAPPISKSTDTSTPGDYTNGDTYANAYQSAGPSMYGPHRNSIIMRMVETKAVPSMRAAPYSTY